MHPEWVPFPSGEVAQRYLPMSQQISRAMWLISGQGSLIRNYICPSPAWPLEHPSETLHSLCPTVVTSDTTGWRWLCCDGRCFIVGHHLERCYPTHMDCTVSKNYIIIVLSNTDFALFIWIINLLWVEQKENYEFNKNSWDLGKVRGVTLTPALKAQSKREREAFQPWQEKDSEFGDLDVVCSES